MERFREIVPSPHTEIMFLCSSILRKEKQALLISHMIQIMQHCIRGADFKNSRYLTADRGLEFPATSAAASCNHLESPKHNPRILHAFLNCNCSHASTSVPPSSLVSSNLLPFQFALHRPRTIVCDVQPCAIRRRLFSGVFLQLAASWHRSICCTLAALVGRLSW